MVWIREQTHRVEATALLVLDQHRLVDLSDLGAGIRLLLVLAHLTVMVLLIATDNVTDHGECAGRLVHQNVVLAWRHVAELFVFLDGACGRV